MLSQLCSNLLCYQQTYSMDEYYRKKYQKTGLFLHSYIRLIAAGRRSSGDVDKKSVMASNSDRNFPSFAKL